MADLEFFCCPERHVVEQEEVHARPLQATLTFLLLPKRLVGRILFEMTPPLGIKIRNVAAFTRGCQEDEVPDEIGGGQGLTPRIQGLEDNLRVVLCFELDGYKLNVTDQRLHQDFGSFLLREGQQVQWELFVIVVQIGSDGRRKENIR